jgi:hypothetical protein
MSTSCSRVSSTTEPEQNGIPPSGHDPATFLVEQKKAHFILVVKKNQPSLYRQLVQRS